MQASDLVILRGITKQFQGIAANDGIDLKLVKGEIHALLGENGAGKTTLMNILTGLYRPDGGEISVWGESVRFRSPKDALQRGIGMVHQHFQLVDVFTVTENVLLGARSSGFRLRREQTAKTVAELARSHGLAVDPAAAIWQLSVGERQRVEILKLLFRGAELLILDEPTAVLTPGEADDLYRALRRLADQGKAVVFITHKLKEVMAAADRVTVLRGGRVVGSMRKDETSAEQLAALMIGGALPEQTVQRARVPGPPALAVKGLCARSDRGTSGLQRLDLTIHQGEIVGVAGVAGNGQRELAEAIAGLRPATAGTVAVGEKDVTGAGALATMKAGLRYVPEDRLGTGLVPQLDLIDNTMLRDYRQPPLGRGWWVDRGAARAKTKELIHRFGIKAVGAEMAARNLSGGNQQKLLVGREFSGNPLAIIVAQPTRGLDVGAALMVHDQLLAMREQGAGILLISEDLDEVLALSDRVAVMYGGVVVDVLPAQAADRRLIGRMMGGGGKEGAVGAT